MNITELSNSQLLAELDDIVQRLAHQNNEEWATNHTEDKQLFEQVKNELAYRLCN